MSPQLQSMLQQAIQAFQGGNFDMADSILKRVLQVDPKNLLALNGLGLIKASEAKYTEAANFFGRAARISPNDASIQFNLAKALTDSGNDKAAIAHHKKAVALTPKNPDAWLSYGIAVSNLGRYEDALVYFNKALSLNPNSAEAWSCKGATMHELKRFDEAITLYDKALSLNPNSAEAWSWKGATMHELKRFDEAITLYDKALSLNPNLAGAWSCKGATMHELKRFDEAIANYGKALSLKSDLDWIYGDLVHTKLKICSWTGLADSSEDISKKIMENEKVSIPFILLALNDDALLHKKSSEILIQSKYPFNPILGPILKRPQSQKIRIGYFSADFRNHAVSLLTAELYELHDKNKFEIIAFSFGVDDKGPMRLRLSQAFNQFIDVSDMSDLEIAKLARDLQIDIAVDLGGHTQDSRTGIFSNRAAPIQISYIGYLGTMGAEYYDYLLADETIIPDELQKFYAEKIVYLPSYQVSDRKRTISERQFTREELGLPETGFVFCCFNNNYKILPSAFDGWMRILNAVEGSVLFLYADNGWAKANLIAEASLRGVDSARLVFGGRIPREEYLARYRVCDLFLDTFPYNAGTTASDALWTGLPILTRMGRSFASRVAASLLNAIGLPELITNTQEEYETLAIELAMNPQKLADIKLKLAHTRLTTPLFDTPLFTKNLESAYTKMYERYQNDLGPDHISIV
jgi:predicted O-linked N-acetylglucosamine transferase (SPINDLY family)